MHYFGIIVLILLSTLLASAISIRLGMPGVVGQLIAGIILGPGILNLVQETSLVKVGAEIGVVLLMFIAGMESDLELLKKYFKPALSVAIFGVVAPMICFYILGSILKMNFEHAIFLGIIFSATSVSISVEVLREFKKLDSVEGTVILGAAVVDDIIAVILLSVFVSSFGVGQSQGNIWLNLAMQVAYFILVYGLITWLAPRLLNVANRLPINGSATMVSLGLCFGMAWLAESIGLSDVVGAFFAGVAISQTKYLKEVVKDVNPIGYAFFIPIFFVSIGLSMRFDHIMNSLGLIVGMFILAVLTKWLGGALGAKLTKINWLSSNVIGGGMISRGEMALIVAQIGFSSHLLLANLYSEVIIVIVLTTIFAPLFLKYLIPKLDQRSE
ncbi:cation:proton antiporter [Lentilactobacillus laojiaonis]|uniref:cation:proton antiporter n=1 Tax=Lentilactobacillus laojiaonis TaxID=2883998 RepID=UPI001D0B384E|nr:cation:proton antiporter [Lentilactobacillus laojiaonis]UDM32319.1 cation:proton antiporter [Lentilactobacillus laojiaonis]